MTLNPLSLGDIHPDAQSHFTKQKYEKKPVIDGVKIVELKTFVEDGGYFLEVARVGEVVFEAFPEFVLKQMNVSEIHPGTIKAGHVHFNQEDVWFTPPSQKLLVGLKDLRKNFPTYGTTMRFVLGAGQSKLLYIPRGVAHGCSNPYNRDQMLFYFVNQHFNPDPSACDEWRVPPEQFGEGFWQIAKG